MTMGAKWGFVVFGIFMGVLRATGESQVTDGPGK